MEFCCVASDLTLPQFELVWSWLPTHMRMYDARRIFCSERDGYSLNTLYSRCAQAGPCLLLVQSTDDKVWWLFSSLRACCLTVCLQVFGGYSSHPWSKATFEKFFGSRECFVFTLSAPATPYKWRPPLDDSVNSTLMQDAFMMCGKDFISLGGGEYGRVLIFLTWHI